MKKCNRMKCNRMFALPKRKNQKAQNQTYFSANVIIITKSCNHTKLLKGSVRKLQDYTKYSSYGNKSILVLYNVGMTTSWRLSLYRRHQIQIEDTVNSTSRQAFAKVDLLNISVTKCLSWIKSTMVCFCVTFQVHLLLAKNVYFSSVLFLELMYKM